MENTDYIYKPEKSSVTFFAEDGLQIYLAYNWSPQNRPYSTFLYWANKDPRECLWNFKAEEYGKDRIENYWREVLKLNSEKELDLDTLYKTMEKTFLPERQLRLV
jgi:hypothetical protein